MFDPIYVTIPKLGKIEIDLKRRKKLKYYPGLGKIHVVITRCTLTNPYMDTPLHFSEVVKHHLDPDDLKMSAYQALKKCMSELKSTFTKSQRELIWKVFREKLEKQLQNRSEDIQFNFTVTDVVILKRKTPSLYPSIHSAKDGFILKGIPVHEFDSFRDIPDELFREEVLPVGGLGFVTNFINRLNIKHVPILNYPNSLEDYLNRDIQIMTLNEVASSPERFPIFVKPVVEKQFTGRVVRTFGDLIGTKIQGVTQQVYVSEVVNLDVEYRCYIQNGKLIKACCYSGDFTIPLDYDIIRRIIHDFKEAPSAYTLDLGVEAYSDKHYLIEVTEGYSVANYGLSSIEYANFLQARWLDIVN